MVLSNQFPKPCVFAVVLAWFGLAVAQWIAAWTADFSRKACKKWGFGNMDKKKHVKTHGSAPGNRRNLVFYSIFLSLRWALLGFSGFVYPSEEPPGPPPSPATKSPFPYESFNSREPFSQSRPKSILAGRNYSSGEVPEGLRSSQNTWFTPCSNASKRSKPRKIRDSRRVLMLRRAQSLAKYVIHAVFSCFEALKTSQNTWFTPCFNASKRSKPRKIRDSRHVLMLRTAQSLAKYVIHAVF